MDAELSRLNKKLQAADRAKVCRYEYSILKTDSERFAYTIGLLDEYEIVDDTRIRTEEKSSKVSEHHRKAGNELFLSGRGNESTNKILELYTKSLAYAEQNSRELAFAYGNRSAVLFTVGLYDHCLLDIERALSLDYPDNLKVKLLARRVNCLRSRDDESQAQIEEAIDEAHRCMERMSLDDAEIAKRSMKNLEKKFGPQRCLFDEERFKPTMPNDNPEISGVSGALRIAHNEQFGRHIVAARKILPGQVLAIQRGYATILAPEHFYTHCSNCLRQTWSAVPCDKCPRAVYCNVACRDEAWKDHHDVECRVIGALIELEFNLLGLMSLRLAIRAVREAGSFESLEKKIESLEAWSDPRTKGFTGTPLILNEDDYSSVYTLATNTEKRSSPDIFGRSFNSVFIVYCIATMTNFLGEKLPPDLKTVRNHPWSIFLGGLITRHQQIIPSNVHAVTETKGILDRERGASIIPFLSLFNHSCDCMVVRIHYGRHVVLYALQTIEAGEQVCDNYGMHYAVEDRHSRLQRLQRQYFFTCECRACTENWPLFSEIPSWTEMGLSRKDRSKLTKALKNFTKYVDFATDGNVDDKLYIIKDLQSMITILFDHVDLPCREVNEVVETLKRVYALLSTRYQSL